MHLFEESAAQHLLGCQAVSSVLGANFVTHIL